MLSRNKFGIVAKLKFAATFAARCNKLLRQDVSFVLRAGVVLHMPTMCLATAVTTAVFATVAAMRLALRSTARNGR